MANIYIPVFDLFNQTERKAVAVMTSTIHWRKVSGALLLAISCGMYCHSCNSSLFSAMYLQYFGKILPSNIKGIVVVLENSCEGAYTYEIHGRSSFKFQAPSVVEAGFNWTPHSLFSQYPTIPHNSKEMKLMLLALEINMIPCLIAQSGLANSKLPHWKMVQ